jgi:hypothetical protein
MSSSDLGKSWLFYVDGSDLTVTLPASPTLGDEVEITVVSNTAHKLTINQGSASEKINVTATSLELSVTGASTRLVYWGTIGAVNSWMEMS